jgi:hypothetical protein
MRLSEVEKVQFAITVEHIADLIILYAQRFALPRSFKGQDVVAALQGRGCREKVQLLAGRIEPTK